MASGDFSDLLFEAEKLTSDIEGTGDLPKVERSLRQVLEASSELYSRVTQTGAQDIQANLLLGSKGIDLPRIAQKLESLSTKRTFEPLEPIADTDVSSFLKNEIENCILSVIDEVQAKTDGDIEDQMREHVFGQWKEEKRKILNAVIGPSENFLDLQKQMKISFVREQVGPTVLTQQELTYANIVNDYNKAILKGIKRHNLLDAFVKAADGFNDKKVSEMWAVMSFMLQIPPLPRSEDVLKSRNSPVIKTALVKQAKLYLEGRYKVYMVSIVSDNLQLARRGGIPGAYSLVKSFVGIRLQGGYLGLQDGTVDDRPLWPMVYYCLRCGDLTAALHCLHKAGSGFEELAKVIEDRIRGAETQTSKNETAVKFLYHRYVRNATDPFKRIVFCILGCCDINDDHTEVANSADDYLWLKLNMVRNDDVEEEHINLSDLQRNILEEYGESHYQAQQQPHLYFQVLALTGQFEAALEFLSRADRYRPHAVHMAITMSELYLLGGPRNVDAPLISVDVEDPVPARRLNFARLIIIYVKKFEIVNPDVALHYFFLLRKLFDADGRNLFVLSVMDLALETRDFNLFFGVMQPNGARTNGLVDQFSNIEMSTNDIAEVVAMQLVKKGFFEDAIKLYDLAGNQEEALSLTNTLLSQVVHLPSETGSLRDRLKSLTNDLTVRYSSDGFKCTSDIVGAFTILKELLIFFDHYHNKQSALALETLNQLHIVPQRLIEVDEKVSSFKRMRPEVSKVIPDVLLATMSMLYEQYRTLRANESFTNRFDDEVTERQLSFLRERAKAITNYAGSVPYRMPGDTNGRLVQIEILMH